MTLQIFHPFQNHQLIKKKFKYNKGEIHNREDHHQENFVIQIQKEYGISCSIIFIIVIVSDDEQSACEMIFRKKETSIELKTICHTTQKEM